MSDLRTAAQQALKILELEGWGYPSPKTAEAITALRAALAEPVQEPVGEVEAIDEDKEEGTCHAIVALYNPVNLGDKVYTTPPQRKPLTEEEMMDEFCKTPGIHQFVSAFFAGARYAERAHGIKE